MKLTTQDDNLAVVDEVLSPEAFTNFWNYFNRMDFAYRSMTGWQKVWRINDGQILAGPPYYNSQGPFDDQMEWVRQNVSWLAKEHFEKIVGKEGEDWNEILFTPYIYPAGTKISWHNDHGYTGACIFYPHEKWNPHWGGELMVAKTLHGVNGDPDNDLITREFVAPILDAIGMGVYVAPLPNRMVFTSGSVWHGINRVDQAAGDNARCSVVAFFMKDKVE